MDLTTTPPVTETSSADMERAVAVIALAFTADPVMSWIFPDRGQYLTYFPAFLRVLASTAVQHGTALQVGDCAGVALWLPPNVGPDRAAISAIMHEGVAPSRQAEVFAFMERTGSYRPTAPYWWLPLIGVDPVYHHKGFGSALLRHALVRCDSDHMPAHLETGNPANVRLYERHGFKSLGQLPGRIVADRVSHAAGRSLKKSSNSSNRRRPLLGIDPSRRLSTYIDAGSEVAA